jgi:hypothetical protein
LTEAQNADRVITIMRNCSGQLRRAHADLGKINAPIDSLTKISGVADALDALAQQVSYVVEEAEKARRTAGGLTAEVHQLRDRVRNKESGTLAI